MEVKVKWQGKLSFEGVAESGFKLPLGARVAVGGDEDGFRPMELMALSLAGCTAMDVISILQKKRQEVSSFDVRVDADRSQEHPRVITRAVIEYTVVGKGIDEAAVQRSIHLSAVRYCPAQAMLGQIIPIELRYKIYEELDGGEPHLVTSGVYGPEAEPQN